ncbi:hypothetical protein RLIN73S_06226 [Rhodanobacter lindaniclasticus]
MYIATNAPASDSGTATAAISVGASRRRNSAMVSTTIASEISKVACTSCSEARMVGVPSKNGVILVPGCRNVRSAGSCALTRSTVEMTLASDFLYTYISTAGRPPNQAA